jgi:mRNA interferase RelE/StbE
MTWEISFTPKSEKQFKQLDRPIQTRIAAFLFERLAKLDNPRSIGEALIGSELGEFWKYRVGDYRVITQIQNQELCVLVLKIGHRKDVYK